MGSKLLRDPHPAVFGDTCYLYPTTDGSEGWMATSFRAWLSKDLMSWKDEGVLAYHRFRIPGGNGCNREACLSPLRIDADGAIRAADVFEPVSATVL